MLIWPISALHWFIYTIPSAACFFIIVLAYAIVGFIRGWRKELVSLLFYIIAFFLVSPNSNQSFVRVIDRLPSAFGYLMSGRPQDNETNTTAPFLGPWGSLLVFILIVAIGYYLGNKAFPGLPTLTERILGILPALVEAALVLSFLNSSNFFVRDENGQLVSSIALQPPDPAQFVPILLIISILVIIGGLIAARVRKTPAKK